VTVLAALGVAACTSVQWIDGAGQVRMIGLGVSTTVEASGGTVTRVVTPGLALRLVPSASQYGIGYQETTLFQGRSKGGGHELLAVGECTYGVAIGSSSFMVGADRGLAIVSPENGRSIVQEIHYTAGHPAASWLVRREVE
jgi:hypothetical protein